MRGMRGMRMRRTRRQRREAISLLRMDGWVDGCSCLAVNLEVNVRL